MRRAEYVAAAVRYYKALLDGKQNISTEISDLKRTYNRGNYTKGLAFGQDKRLLSTAIQGHIGEKVGVVKVVNGKFLVESKFQPRMGDAFKILRNGKEIGGAIFLKTEGKCFVLSSKQRLKNGDGVFITTDTAVNERVLSSRKIESLKIGLYFAVGQPAKAICGDLVIEGETPLLSAQTRPLTQEELKACFLKTDGLPVCIEFEQITLQGNIFIPKSELNAIRRRFYEAVCERIAKGNNTPYEVQELSLPILSANNTKTTVIASDFDGVETDIAVYKADDFSKTLPPSFIDGNFEKYIYYPSFANAADLATISAWIKEGNIDGIYAENFGGIAFAKTHKIKLFAGTGFNLINSLSIAELLKEDVSYYAISKEANTEEISALGGKGAFVFSLGDIKVMDLCYCPFEKTCARCDRKSIYSLTDEGGRVFPVRRYVAADGNCRFEVYNCAKLIGSGIKGIGQLLDLTLVQDKRAAIQAKDSETQQKKLYANYTSGHYKRGVL